MFSGHRVVFLTLMLLVVPPVVAKDDCTLPDCLHVKSSGLAEAWVHFEPALLREYSLDRNDIAKSAASILDFEAATWQFPAPVAWDVYFSEVNVTLSATGEPAPQEWTAATFYQQIVKAPGASQPGPLACITLIGLANMSRAAKGGNEQNSEPISEPFSRQVAYEMAHEATHCYLWFTSKEHQHAGGAIYPGARWLTEGVAGWLAGDYIESLGRPFPSYYAVSFLRHHRENLLSYGYANVFFFKWLEGAQGLKSRAAVMGFVTDMFDTPWPKPPSDCGEICSTPLYADLLKKWFLEKQERTIARLLSDFGSAVVRGTVPGISTKRARFFRLIRTLDIQPGYNAARLAFLGTGVPEPVPLGQVSAIYAETQEFVPESFGWVAFEVRLSEPLIPPPAAYLVGMERGNNDINVNLSNEESDTVIDQSGWVLTPKPLEGQWFSVARTDVRAGKDARILLKACSVPSCSRTLRR
jgi:hypothetical protein